MGPLLPARALPAPRALAPRMAGLRATLHRLWTPLWAGPTPEACLTCARTRAALRAEYQARLDLYPATLYPATRPGGERP